MNDAESDDTLGEFTSPDGSAIERQMRPIVDAVEDILQKMTPAVPAVTKDVSQAEGISHRFYYACGFHGDPFSPILQTR